MLPRPDPVPTLLLAALVGVAALTSCSAPEPQPSFDSLDPADRVRAALEAETADQRVLVELVAMLDSSDPAQRMIASSRLRELTDQDFGYDHAAPEPERRAAADRWALWVQGRTAR